MITTVDPSRSQTSLQEANFSSLCSQLRAQVQGGLPGILSPLEQYASSLELLRAQIVDCADETLAVRTKSLQSAEELTGKIETLREPLRDFLTARNRSFPDGAFRRILKSIDDASKIAPAETSSIEGAELKTALLSSLEGACAAVNKLLLQERQALDGGGTTLAQLYEGKGDGREMRKLLNAATGKLGTVLRDLIKYGIE